MLKTDWSVCRFFFKNESYCDQIQRKDVEIDLERNLRAEAVERTNQMEQTLPTLNQKCSSLLQLYEDHNESLRLMREQVQRLGGKRERERVGGREGSWTEGEL